MPKAPTVVDTSAPHWATDLANATLERERLVRDQQTAADAHGAQLAAVLRRDGQIWAERLAAELASIAAAVNARVGRPILVMSRTLSGSVSIAATSGAYVLFAFGFVGRDPESRTPSLEVLLQAGPSASCTRMTMPYDLDVNDADALVIRGLDLGPEAFAEVVCAPWLQTLQFKGR